MPLSATSPFMFLTVMSVVSTSGSKPSSASTASRMSLFLVMCQILSVTGRAVGPPPVSQSTRLLCAGKDDGGSGDIGPPYRDQPAAEDLYPPAV